MSTDDKMPEPVHAGSLLANDDVYLARDVRAALDAQAEKHAAERDALRAQVKRLEHNVSVLTDAVWKACGDDEGAVNATIESQGTLK